MVEKKFRLPLNNTAERIYYERPSFSLDGKKFSCVVPYEYKIGNSSILTVQVDANASIDMRVEAENFTEQGYTIVKLAYKLLVVKDNRFYFIDDDGLIKTGVKEDKLIRFDELGIEVKETAYDMEANTITLPRICYVEDGILKVGNNEFPVIMDKGGVAKYQRLWDDYVCLIKDRKKYKWAKKTRLTFTVSHDVELPIHYLQLAKFKHSFYYLNKQYDLNEQWDEKLPNAIQCYIYGKPETKESNVYELSNEQLDESYKKIVWMYDFESDEEIEDTSESLSDTDADVSIYESAFPIIKIGSTPCQVHTSYKIDNAGSLILIYADTDMLSVPIMTTYFIAERLHEYMEKFYINDGTISVLGQKYDVTTAEMVNFDGWKELTEVGTYKGRTVYSLNADEQSSILLVSMDNNELGLWSEYMYGHGTPTVKYPHQTMNKVTVNGENYYAEQSVTYTKPVNSGNDFTTEIITEVPPFYIPIKPKYRLNILDYIEPNCYVCGFELEGLSWLDRKYDDVYASLREDIKYNLREYSIKYQPPQFILDKTDEQALLRRYGDLLGADMYVDPMPNLTITRFLHDTIINLPIISTFNDNLFQEIWVKDKFVEVKKRDMVNHTIDMEKDIYYPMKQQQDKKLTDVTDVEFYLHFRTRNEDWNINEDFKGTYENTYDINKDEKPSNADSLEEVKTLLNTSWNILDYYQWPKNESSDTPIESSNATDYLIDTDTNRFYQPSDLLAFLDFDDNDVFYQKSKIKKSFLRISFFDSRDPRTQSLLGTSTIFLDSGVLFGIFSDSNANSSNGITYVSPRDWDDTSRFISVDKEPIINQKLSFNESRRLSSRLIVSDKLATTASAEGFYTYIFKEYSSGLHERTIYAKFQFNHAGKGALIDLFQPMKKTKDGLKLVDFSKQENREELMQGLSIKDVYNCMYVPIKVKYDFETKKHCWYLPDLLPKDATDNDNKIKFNLYEIKIKNYDAPIAQDSEFK